MIRVKGRLSEAMPITDGFRRAIHSRSTRTLIPTTWVSARFG